MTNYNSVENNFFIEFNPIFTNASNYLKSISKLNLFENKLYLHIATPITKFIILINEIFDLNKSVAYIRKVSLPIIQTIINDYILNKKFTFSFLDLFYDKLSNEVLAFIYKNMEVISIDPNFFF